jgi:hypothetical protein
MTPIRRRRRAAYYEIPTVPPVHVDPSGVRLSTPEDGAQVRTRERRPERAPIERAPRPAPRVLRDGQGERRDPPPPGS